MPTARYNLSANSVDGKIYAIGGFHGNWAPYSVVEEYNPVTDTWTEKKDMPTPRGFSATSVVDGQIYVIGGAMDTRSALSTVEIYDPATDSWEVGPDMPTARVLPSASAVNGKIYVIGGSISFRADAPLSIVEEYDTRSVAVEPREKLPTTWGEIKSD